MTKQTDATSNVEQLVDALSKDDDLVKYLLDTDTANFLSTRLAEETGLPPLLFRLAFKLIGPLLVNKTKQVGSWLGGRAASKLANIFKELPVYGVIDEKLRTLRAWLDDHVDEQQRLKDILAGKRPVTDLEHAESLSQELRLGLRQLAELEAIKGHIETSWEKLLQRLNPQPPLTLKLLELNEVNRLKFGARRVPFVGRTEEMTNLRQFLESPKRFCWCSVTGGAGQGKSRLALELCLGAGMAWRAGFLTETTNFDAWETWQPETATVIVVDYVSARKEQVRRIISTLINREHIEPLEAPVRLLLLERSLEDKDKKRSRSERIGSDAVSYTKEETSFAIEPVQLFRDSGEGTKYTNWLEELIGSDSTGYAIEHAAFAAKPLQLGPMSEDDLWQSIVAIFKNTKKPLPDRAETLAALKEIDPRGRPLFAAFAADALADHGNLRDWDQERLLRDVLRREREHYWKPAGVVEADQNLLALATITRGLPVNALQLLASENLFPTPDDYNAVRYQIMSGLPATEFLAPLEPDILGELFVLAHLEPRHAMDTRRAEQIHRIAWHFDPLASSAFLDRATADFINHPTLTILFTPPPEGRLERYLWSKFAVRLIAFFGRGRKVDKARMVYDQLAALVAKYPDGADWIIRNPNEFPKFFVQYLFKDTSESEFRYLLAAGANNMSVISADVADYKAACDYYDKVVNLATSHSEEAALRKLQANNAGYLIGAFGSVGKLGSARELYHQLVDLASEHPDEPELREIQATTAFNLITDHGEHGQRDTARVLYDELASLAKAHPEEPFLREKQAHSIHNLTSCHLKSGELDDAVSLFEQLTALATMHPDEPNLRKSQADVLFNLVTGYGQAGKLDIARKFYNQLSDLVKGHREESVLREFQATAAFNLVTLNCDAGQGNSAEQIYEHLTALAMEYPEEPFLRECQVNSCFNLINYYCQAEDPNPVIAYQLYEQLSALAAAYPEEPHLREVQAKGAYSLITSFCLGRPNVAHRLYEQISDLATMHSDEPILQEMQALGAYNLITAYCQVSERGAAHDLYGQLAALVAAHPDKPDLLELQGKAIVNLINAYRHDGDRKTAHELYGELTTLVKAHPNDPALGLRQAESAHNFIDDYRYQKEDLNSARDVARSAISVLRSSDFISLLNQNFGSQYSREFGDFLSNLLDDTKNKENETSASFMALQERSMVRGIKKWLRFFKSTE